MLRRVFGVASVLSLLLLIATAALWVWSYHTGAEAVLHQGIYSRGEYDAGTRGGQIFFRVRPNPQPIVLNTVVDGKRVPVNGPVPLIGNTAYAVQSDPAVGVPGVWWSELFFAIPMSYGPPLRQVYLREMVVSLWLPCAVFSVLPALWLATGGHRRRYAPGFCHRCGYSLTGNLSGTCPECGTALKSECNK